MLMRMIHGKREVNKTKERMSVLEGMKGLMNLAHIWRHWSQIRTSESSPTAVGRRQTIWPQHMKAGRRRILLTQLYLFSLYLEDKL